ncbi:MAG TPA: hypothetical protein VF812_09300 [Ktedonobacterales bacterium]
MRRLPGQAVPSSTLLARRLALMLTLALTLAAPLLLASCASATVTATATPIPECVQLEPSATPFTGIAGISGLTLPSGTYITSPNYAGGGAGAYRIATYTVCFQGDATAVSGASAGATFTKLQASGWAFNNLFPDPTNFSYIDYCSNSHNCFNSSGTSTPFTFIGFQQYATPAAGYTTFTLQVATIAAPSCLNDPTYYSGTPKYALYYDSNSASSSGNPQNHFLMPPGTRVSSFLGGGTAGSVYAYYCSAGTQASVIGFLKQAMSNVGWTISNATASGFSASYGSGPTYQIDILVQNPNNYYLRVFVPM